MRKQALILVCIVVFGVAGSCHGGSLKKGYYDNTCPDAEAIIKNATEKRVANDPTLPARFLRMHFHDCFVRVRLSKYCSLFTKTCKMSLIINA
ncbi:hypothetical protein PVK06_042198 [Gossypium arboreum]|uniref:peroxidase n=1 Tax=Gossypium arboreum TaxID=29729 RepID=A0ABR0MK64_GOSAR|nr:hypothetical protein PVK06_042198 [Gossypium arboreum]